MPGADEVTVETLRKAIAEHPLGSDDLNNETKVIRARQGFFGDRSTLARVLRAPLGGTRAGKFTNLANVLLPLAERDRPANEKLEAILGACEKTRQVKNEPELLAGLAHALAAAQDICDRSTASGNIKQAIECFDRLWGAADGKVSSFDFLRRMEGDVLDDAFHELGQVDCTPLGLYTVYDLLDRWLVATNRPAASARSATVTLLGAGPKTGHVLRLTVELLPAVQGCFCPDPLYLGLTRINDPHHGVLRSMSRMWEASRLSARFRGRWRIEHELPSVKERSGGEPSPREYKGPSLEAAALCALLAASGNPYRESDIPDDSLPEAIDPQVTISATVNAARDGQAPIKLSVGIVGEHHTKLSAVKELLDTVLFSHNEVDDEDNGVGTVEKTQKGEKYDKVRVERVSTVEEALDHLLVTNRFLRRYQQEVKNCWRNQWAPGTAEPRSTGGAKDAAPGAPE